MTDDDLTATTLGDPAAVPLVPAATPTVATGARRFRTVGVVGLGYVGLPLAGAFLEAERRVLGFDVDAERVAMLAAGGSYLEHLNPRTWRGGEPGGLEATCDLSRVAECDAVCLCLPTPLDAEGRPDLGPLERAARALAPHLRAGQLVVLHSTTWPGTTREVLAPLLAGDRLQLGSQLLVAYSPEREDPGRDVRTRRIPRLVGGLCEASGDAAEDLLSLAVERVHRVARAEIAEAAKLHENVYRAVNIALVDELAELYRALGLDPRAVIDAAATKPFGFEAFRPGPGPGGHCIPVDPRYLTWAAARVGARSELLDRSIARNASTPLRVAARVGEALEARGRSLVGARVLLLGVAYKADVGDARCSPALPLAGALHAAGAQVVWCDPHVQRLPAGEHHGLPQTLVDSRPVPLDRAEVESADAIVIVTDHRALDLDLIAGHARLVIDTRGALRGYALPPERYVPA
ncbi:nucleotide sugar dehydrogenase [Engelhardtia mirabilis]|uniref:UDP-N-acetyl-D-glucosamine 6-dehydrogenase n=1 Tax=Engelhardtia mirabilis TaxID=2528011 RepID=A0A518BJJ2_9BACT|nr:UDP-N-acetyl-D-glucosamine 6-dehydrogenase [Planctomycetes bacterium Pla133]QDV01465.1 UDP-N-acetyl-D-glucosamine 6-dehydrogenase [Planctomycetes bacterium Pla86]